MVQRRIKLPIGYRKENVEVKTYWTTIIKREEMKK